MGGHVHHCSVIYSHRAEKLNLDPILESLLLQVLRDRAVPALHRVDVVFAFWTCEQPRWDKACDTPQGGFFLRAEDFFGFQKRLVQQAQKEVVVQRKQIQAQAGG